MGQVISSNLEWRADGRLKRSEQNATVLSALLEAIANVSDSFPTEASIAFAQPLAFTTRVHPSALADNPAFVQTSPTTFTSDETDGAGKPLYTLEGGDGAEEEHVAEVRSVGALARHLGVATSPANELRAVLEAEPRAVNKVAGVEGEAGDILMAGFRLMNMQSGAEAAATAERMQLMIVVNQIDLELLAKAVDDAKSSTSYLTRDHVLHEMEYLGRFVANSVQSILASLEFDPNFEFGGDPRVPPWREARGDLAYILARTTDAEEFTITASRRGYFLNKGYVGVAGSSALNYEAASAVAPSLVDLLRASSPRVAKHVDEQLFRFRSRAGGEYRSSGGGSGGNGDGGGVGGASKATGRRGAARAGRVRRRRARGERTRREAEEEHGGGARRRRTLEDDMPPSSKWVDLEENAIDYEYLAEQRRVRELEAAAVHRSTLDELLAGTVRPPSGSGGRWGGGRGGGASPTGRDFDGNAFSDDESEDEVVEFQPFALQQRDYPLFERVQKLIAILRTSTETATVLCLVHLLDAELEKETAQLAILEGGGLEVLVNLLTVHYSRPQLASLQVLSRIMESPRMMTCLEGLDGIAPLCDLCATGSDAVKQLAAMTLAKVCTNARNRRAVRRHGAVPWIVAMLDTSAVAASPAALDVLGAAAKALYVLAASAKNQRAIRDAGVAALLARLVTGAAHGEQVFGDGSGAEALLVPVVGILERCGDDASFRADVRGHGLIPYVVALLSSSNLALRTQAASALFKLAEDKETQALVSESGLVALVKLLETDDEVLLQPVTGCVWKLASSMENVSLLSRLGAVSTLVAHVSHPNEVVVVNAVGALTKAAASPPVRRTIYEAGGIAVLVDKLKETNEQLLINASQCLGACAIHPLCLKVILDEDVDGVKYLWSLLKKKSNDVVESAAWSIASCISSGAVSGHLINQFVGGLELIVGLLKVPDDNVRAGVCAVISQIAKNNDNLAVITDHGVIWLLSDLTPTTNDHLRQYLADAIAECCSWGSNGVGFGQAGAVRPLVGYLASADPDVHRATARALHALSFHAANCLQMHEEGVVPPLLDLIASPGPDSAAEAAAGALSNIRALALANERAAANPSAAADPAPADL